jgi:hypothetical protein
MILILTRGEWDNMFKEGKFIQEYCPTFQVLWMGYKAVFPTSARDMCTATYATETPDGEITIGNFI